jgi:uncharacterized membrane protein YkvA (DUF1232 family)
MRVSHSYRVASRPRRGSRLRQWARSLKREALAVYLAIRDPRTPWYAKALGLCVAGYAFSPIDLIPDFVPLLGYLDDILIVPLGIWVVMKLIPSQVMAESRMAAALAADRPVSKKAATVIVLVWILSLTLSASMAYRHIW